MGLPVVTADHPHRRAYVERARCGLVVPADDPAAWADALGWLQEHAEEASLMGARGREAVRDRFLWGREEGRLLAFYRELTRVSRRGPAACGDR